MYMYKKAKVTTFVKNKPCDPNYSKLSDGIFHIIVSNAAIIINVLPSLEFCYHSLELKN